MFLASSLLIVVFNHAVIGASPSPSTQANVGAVFPGTSDLTVIATQGDDCLSRWRHATAEQPEIHIAGLELFVQSECGSLSVPGL
jgi:hypothetical protein